MDGRSWAEDTRNSLIVVIVAAALCSGLAASAVTFFVSRSTHNQVSTEKGEGQ